VLSVRRALKDILAGLIFIGFGGAFAVIATTYEVGTTLEMGPGYFPLVLGVLLALLGVAIIVKGFIGEEGLPMGRVPWRAIALVTAALIVFGVTVRGLGLVPSVFLTTTLAGYAGPRSGPVLPVIIAAGITLVTILIFVVGLQLRLPLFGPWIPLP
jgi:hypothetical protein